MLGFNPCHRLVENVCDIRGFASTSLRSDSRGLAFLKPLIQMIWRPTLENANAFWTLASIRAFSSPSPGIELVYNE